MAQRLRCLCLEREFVFGSLPPLSVYISGSTDLRTTKASEQVKDQGAGMGSGS